MELTRRLKVVAVSSLMLAIFCFDSQVFSAPLSPLAANFPDLRFSVGSDILCNTCVHGVGILQKMFRSGVSRTIVEKTAIEICETFDIEDDYVCENIVPIFKDEVVDIFSRTALKSNEICGTLLGADCKNTYDPFNQTWTILIPGNKPPVKVPTPNPAAPHNRILHLTDIHWDPQYTEGLTTQCGEPLCCRPHNKKADKPEDAAGPWGDPHCDMPYKSIINLMEQLNNTSPQFDWVYVTGDLPAHNDWTQTRDDQLSVLTNITKLFKKYLPSKPIFFSIGNHESSPVNSFPPPYITDKQSESWLYDKAAEVWSDWLTPDAVKTLKYGGFYSMEVKPDLKIISLQTNFCNKGNWWLLINSTDPANMMKWLSNELLESEKKGQKVHILGHIPPGSNDCLTPWTKVYLQIVYRFESTIVGQFFGHVHIDSFRVLYSDDGRPISVVYLAPSVTTYGSLNAGYRLYDIDGTHNISTRITLDHSTYIMNITDANLKNKPSWQFEYSARNTYNMTSLLATEWHKVVNRLKEDDKLFQTYHRYLSKSFSPDECNGHCKCSKLDKLVYNTKMSCKGTTREELEQYQQTEKALC